MKTANHNCNNIFDNKCRNNEQNTDHHVLLFDKYDSIACYLSPTTILLSFLFFLFSSHLL